MLSPEGGKQKGNETGGGQPPSVFPAVIPLNVCFLETRMTAACHYPNFTNFNFTFCTCNPLVLLRLWLEHPTPA
jgi:hypothetical protein